MKALNNTIFHNSTKDTLKKISPAAVLYSSLKGISSETRASIRISAESRYRDNTWDLSTEYPDLPPSSVKMHFHYVTFKDGSNITMPEHESYLYSVKEYCYSLIVDPPSSHPKWSTLCISLKKGIRLLLRFMQENKITKFCDLNNLDIENFLELTSATKNKSGGEITNRTLRARIYGLSWLYEQSEKITSGLKVWPLLESASEAQWAFESAQKALPRLFRGTIEMPDHVAASLITCALNDLKLADTILNIKALLKEHVYKRTHIKKIRPDGGYYNTTKINSFPWASVGLPNNGLRALEARFYSACYVLIAMFTGMRFHEIAHIKIGKINNWKKETITTNDGDIPLYFLISKTNKFQAAPTQYLWQTLPLVEQVLDAMERCFASRYTNGSSYLFTGTQGRISSSSINSNLKKFVTTHNIEHGGCTWNLASHQFRKKFSRVMIRQGLGLIALQDQLKHFDIETTKVYGDINIYSELQQEKFLLSEEIYKEIISNQQPIIGGGAEEIINYRKIFVGMTTEDKNIFLRDLPKKAIIEQLDDGMCMYRPQKALCGGNKLNCRPADCNNSIMPVLGLKKTLLWRASENKRLLEFFTKDHLKTAHIKLRIIEINKLLKQLDEHTEA